MSPRSSASTSASATCGSVSTSGLPASGSCTTMASSRIRAVHCDRVLLGADADQRLAGHLEAVRPAKPVERPLNLSEDVLPGRARQPVRGFAPKGGHIE